MVSFWIDRGTKKLRHTHSSGINPELCSSKKVQSVSCSIMSDSLWTPWTVAHQESCVGSVIFLDAILIRNPCSKVIFKGIQAAAGPGPPWNPLPDPPLWASKVALVVKNPPANAGDVGDEGFLGWEDPLEEDMATHSSVLAWRIPWTEEPGGSTQSQTQPKRLSTHACTPLFSSFHTSPLQMSLPSEVSRTHHPGLLWPGPASLPPSWVPPSYAPHSLK